MPRWRLGSTHEVTAAGALLLLLSRLILLQFTRPTKSMCAFASDSEVSQHYSRETFAISSFYRASLWYYYN